MSQQLHIISPADGSVYASRPLIDQDAALVAVGKAEHAQQGWRQVPLTKRIAILRRAIELLEAEACEVAEELAWQMGRPISQGAGEVRGFAERGRYMLAHAATALADVQPLDTKPGYRRFIRREPVGVVFTIAPWNFPYMTAVNSIWPALVAGNAVLLKHAQQTALSGERLERILTKAGLPEGVLQTLHMSHETAATVMQQEAVRLVCFTGSVGGGHAVKQAQAKAPGFGGCGLELGGKDPAYVRFDADIAAAACGLADGAFFNAGQSCCSIERIYVHQSVYQQFVDALVAEAYQLRLGHPLDKTTTLGPLVRVDAAQFVRGQIADAVAAGARTLIDTSRFSADDANGAYLAPQVLVDVDHSMRIMTEESFGPVVGVMPVASDAAAIELMNDSEFGLTASLWTTDADACARLGTQLAAGTVFMNGCDSLDPALAWTGVKHTGRGCTLSSLGFDQMTQPKSFNLKLS